METKARESGVPGLAFVVVQGDEVLLTRCSGVADVESGSPVTPQTVFPIGSSSKPFTSTLIAMLVTEGLMHWDDPVTDYLPELELKVDATDGDAEVTIRDLLAHQTGIVDGAVIMESVLWWKMDGTVVDEDPDPWTRARLLEAFIELEPSFPFRERHSYSNCSMVAAGVASGVAAELTWDELMRERMFEPLGMTSSDTRFESIRVHPLLATGYLSTDDARIPLPYHSLDHVSPAGGISSNILDLTRWLRMLVNHGEFEGERLVGEEELREIWAEHIEAVDLQNMIPGVQYALGWMVHQWNDHLVVEHGGNGYGFAATVALIPELGVGYAMLSNNLRNPLQFEMGPLVWEALVGED